MIRQLYSNTNINLNQSQNSKKELLFPKSTRNSKFKQSKNNEINSFQYKSLNNSSSKKRPRTPIFSYKNINKSFSKESNKRLITQSNKNFIKEYEIYRQNLKDKNRNSSKSNNGKRKTKILSKDKYNYTDIKPKKLDKDIAILVEKKMILLKDINQFRKDKKLLLSLNQQNIEHKHKINLLEKEIEKYKDIIQSCQKNYIDLSYEYSNIKANLEKYIRNNNINKK
jgi:hypothetical protein